MLPDTIDNQEYLTNSPCVYVGMTKYASGRLWVLQKLMKDDCVASVFSLDNIEQRYL